MAMVALYRGCWNALLATTTSKPISVTQRWFAARKGKRAALRLQKRKDKKEKAKTEEPPKWVPHNLRGTREVQSIRKRVQEEDLKPLPAVDDVWIVSEHVQRVFSLGDALIMHRETHHPQMLNQPSALLHATVELDTRLAKKTRYLESFHGTLRYPHLFATSSGTKTILALCKSRESQEEALAAGAEIVGGPDLIKRLQKGELKADAFDYVVAHPDILQELTSIRGLLNRRFPTLGKGNLGANMAALVDRCLNGVDYVSKRDTLELDFGWVDAPFGMLDMPDGQVEENLGSLLRDVDRHRPKGTDRPFVTRTVIWSPPSNEKFVVPFWEYLEGYGDPRLLDVVEQHQREAPSDETISR